jgi:hypothetical protein
MEIRHTSTDDDISAIAIDITECDQCEGEISYIDIRIDADITTERYDGLFSIEYAHIIDRDIMIDDIIVDIIVIGPISRSDCDTLAYRIVGISSRVECIEGLTR